MQQYVFSVSEIDPSGEQPVAVKRHRKKVQPDLDFTKALEEEMPDIFAPPKNPKSLLLPANRAPCNTKLPEDCHYQPEDLIKLFLIPNVKVMCCNNHTIYVFPSKWCTLVLFHEMRFFFLCCSSLEGEARSPQVRKFFLVGW